MHGSDSSSHSLTRHKYFETRKELDFRLQPFYLYLFFHGIYKHHELLRTVCDFPIILCDFKLHQFMQCH
jgi:hypothetical protein